MPSTEQAEIPASLTLVGTALIKHLNIKTGRYQVGIEFRLGVGGFPGKEEGTTIPGGMVGVENITLMPVEADFSGPNVLDAAEVWGGKKTPATKRAKKQPPAQ